MSRWEQKSLVNPVVMAVVVIAIFMLTLSIFHDQETTLLFGNSWFGTWWTNASNGNLAMSSRGKPSDELVSFKGVGEATDLNKGTNFCSLAWQNAVLEHWTSNLSSSAASLNATISVLCDNGTTHYPARSRKWNGHRPSPLTPQDFDSSLLDSVECTLSSGESSRPMTDGEFRVLRYVALFDIPEQLSRAKRHLAEAMAFAKAFNRVLVLPRIGRGRVSMSKKLPFCVYFNTTSIGDFVDWVTYEHFLERSWRLDLNLSTKILCIQKDKLPCDFNEERGVPLLAMTHKTSMDDVNKDLMTFVERDKGIASNPSAIPQKYMTRTFKSFKSNNLVVIWKRSYNLKALKVGGDVARKHVRHSPKLLHVAKRIAEAMESRYVGVHMRMEWLVKTNKRRDYMKQTKLCCRKLERELNKLKALHNVTFVYLASDFSPVTFLKNSDTWNPKVLEEIMPIVKPMIRRMRPLTIESFPQNMSSEGDKSLISVVDLLVLAKAPYFLAGLHACGGERSFDSEVVYYREVHGQKPSSITRFR